LRVHVIFAHDKKVLRSTLNYYLVHVFSVLGLFFRFRF
jgi:hypothetical protein